MAKKLKRATVRASAMGLPRLVRGIPRLAGGGVVDLTTTVKPTKPNAIINGPITTGTITGNPVIGSASSFGSEKSASGTGVVTSPSGGAGWWTPPPGIQTRAERIAERSAKFPSGVGGDVVAGPNDPPGTIPLPKPGAGGTTNSPYPVVQSPAGPPIVVPPNLTPSPTVPTGGFGPTPTGNVAETTRTGGVLKGAALGMPQVSNLTVDVTAPPVVTPIDASVAGLNAKEDTKKYFLASGATGGLGDKLNFDVQQAYKKEFGRAADQGGLDYWRGRAAQGMTPEQMAAEFNGSTEGKEFNLTTDKLDDGQFVTRAYRTVFGRDPDESGKKWLTDRLNQGWSRDDALKALFGSDEFKTSGRTKDDTAVTGLIGQGDAFDPTLKNDETETIVGQHFKAQMGRDPTPYELAKYASAIRGGSITLQTLVPTLQARKAQGWNEGGRVSASGMPVFASGGRLEPAPTPQIGATIVKPQAVSTLGIIKPVRGAASGLPQYNKGGRVQKFAGGGRPQFTYDEYLSFSPNAYVAAGDSEGGGRGDGSNVMSREAFNALSPDDQARLFTTTNPYDTAGNVDSYTVTAGNPIAARYRAANPNAQYAGSGEQTFYLSATKPSDDLLREGAWLDPDSGMWVTPHENIRPEIGQAQRDRIDSSGVFRYSPLGNIALGALGVVGGAFGAEALMGAGAGTSTAPAIAAGTLEDIPASVLASNPAISAGATTAGTGAAATVPEVVGSNAASFGSPGFGGAVPAGTAPVGTGIGLDVGSGLTTGTPGALGTGSAITGTTVGTGVSAIPAAAAASQNPLAALLAWAQANPVQAARLGLSAATLLGAGGPKVPPTTIAPSPYGTYDAGNNPYGSLAAGGGQPFLPANWTPASRVSIRTTSRPTNTGGKKLADGGRLHLATGGTAPNGDMTLQDWFARMTGVSDTQNPLYGEISGMARGWDSPQRQEEEAAAAIERSRQLGDVARQNLKTRYRSPDSAAYLDTLIGNASAAQGAAGANAARKDLRDTKFANMMSAAELANKDKTIAAGLSSQGAGFATSRENSRGNNETSLAVSAGNNANQWDIANLGDRRLRDFQNEDTRRWDLGYGEDAYRYDTNLGQRNYEYDTNLGQRNYEFGQTYGQNERRNIGDYNIRSAALQRGINTDDRGARNDRLANIGRAFYYGSQLPWDSIGRGYDNVSNWASGFFADGGRAAGGGLPRKFMDGQRLEPAQGQQAQDYQAGKVEDTIDAKLAPEEGVINPEGMKIMDAKFPGLFEKLNAMGLEMRKTIAQRGMMQPNNEKIAFTAMG